MLINLIIIENVYVLRINTYKLTNKKNPNIINIVIKLLRSESNSEEYQVNRSFV